MHYCVNGRQPYSVMGKADQIIVKWQDRERIIDFVERLPDKEIVLELTEVPEAKEFETWNMYSEKFKNFYIASYDLRLFDLFDMENIQWYWPYPVTSYYELQQIISLKPSYIKLGPPLSFDLKNVKKLVGNIKLRMVCNNARPEYLPDKQNLPNFFGQFIRPEDINLYEKYIDVIEFKTEDLKKEETLLKIYKEDRNWPGNLNLLLDNLNFHVDNRGIPEEFGPARIECKQRCQAGGACRLCQRAFEFTDALRKEKYRRRKEADIDNN